MPFQKIKINLDYASVMYYAEQMEDEADKLEKRIKDLRNIYTDLKRDWEGPASRMYLYKLRELINKMTSTKNDMYHVVDKIRSTAKSIKAADEKAAENANKLKF